MVQKMIIKVRNQNLHGSKCKSDAEFQKIVSCIVVIFGFSAAQIVSEKVVHVDFLSRHNNYRVELK